MTTYHDFPHEIACFIARGNSTQSHSCSENELIVGPIVHVIRCDPRVVTDQKSRLCWRGQQSQDTKENKSKHYKLPPRPRVFSSQQQQDHPGKVGPASTFSKNQNKGTRIFKRWSGHLPEFANDSQYMFSAGNGRDPYLVQRCTVRSLFLPLFHFDHPLLPHIQRLLSRRDFLSRKGKVPS